MTRWRVSPQPRRDNARDQNEYGLGRIATSADKSHIGPPACDQIVNPEFWRRSQRRTWHQDFWTRFPAEGCAARFTATL